VLVEAGRAMNSTTALGRQMKSEQKARVIRALYQLGREHAQAITPDAVASVVEVAVARGR
jgi:hypothetical protein